MRLVRSSQLLCLVGNAVDLVLVFIVIVMALRRQLPLRTVVEKRQLRVSAADVVCHFGLRNIFEILIMYINEVLLHFLHHGVTQLSGYLAGNLRIDDR